MSARDRKSLERVASSESKYNRAEFYRDFPDDGACLDWLWRHLYSADGITGDCPKCQQARKFHRIQKRPSYSCDVCGHHIHPTAGTIFHKSSTSLRMWFEAIYLMSATRSGISAKQLEREIGVSYKTAWRMMREIRKLLSEDGGPFGGSGGVEIDETYVGGHKRGRRKRGRPATGDPYLTPVFGMVERKGRLVAVTVPNVQRATVYPLIEKRVLPKTTVYTDEFSLYEPLTSKGYHHRRIQHKEAVYVAGDVHTNTVEGFWSLLKRGISGVYHSVSAKHLQSYLDEYSWRYNHRADDQAMFKTLLKNVRVEAVSESVSG